jgi:hypothetical protein
MLHGDAHGFTLVQIVGQVAGLARQLKILARCATVVRRSNPGLACGGGRRDCQIEPVAMY